jgi:Protein of unknown function (DUF2637)
VNGERFARALAGLAVLAVAVVAGIVSFSHIEALALAHGYTLGTARLLPVSVDGLIVAASLACLTEARARGQAPRLPRAGLALGILATLAANVAAGAHFGVTGAVVNAWPAVAFIFASEILLGMLRGARAVPGASGAAGTVAAVVPAAPVVPLETVAGAPAVTASVPVDEPGGTPLPVLAGVPAAAPVASLRPVLRRAPKRASQGKPASAESVFAAEISRGELPSLRAVEAGMHVGTDRARGIRDQLAQVLREAA